ncbi:hypothetical protein MUP79_00440 [Candidatus Bathyarchaeota archaeon]|nr:hypothetical protein [Candidatus Bathyarchaeota archaeon]
MNITRSSILNRVRKMRLFIIVFVASSLLLGLGSLHMSAYAASTGLESLPAPFVSASGSMNCSVVVTSSVGHGPCGGAHTMDVMGAIMVASKLGMRTNSGMLDATMDDYVSSYDFGTAKITIKDAVSNLVIVGGPGVNQVTWYYNNLRNSTGARALPVYFDKDPNGTDCIRVAATNHAYRIQHDTQGRTTTDYGFILMFQDGSRFVMILAGLGGSGTWASCKVISSFDSWDLTGCAAVVRYSDSNSDGLLDDLSIAERVSAQFSLNSSGVLTAGLGLLSTSIIPKLKAIKGKISRRRRLSIVGLVLFLVFASQVSLTAFSSDLGADVYTFKDFAHPFTSIDGLMNCTVVVASSVGHGPCGGAHTMDVMGAVVAASGLGMEAVGGSLSATLDDYVSAYDIDSAKLTFPSLTDNLMVFGGPGVNQVTWYYNNLRNSTGARALPLYFDKDPNGTDCIRVAATNHAYRIQHDTQGRTTTDYGFITVFHDVDNGVWVLIAAGLGGSGTLAASKLLANHKNWSLFGQAAVVRYADSNSDGYLDDISIAESVGVGQSIDVYSDAQCMSIVGSIDWGTLSPGENKNVIVYVRNEGETSVVLSVNCYNWTPAQASNYMTITSNYAGTPLPPGQVLPLTLTLAVNQSISQITNFGVGVNISSG